MRSNSSLSAARLSVVITLAVNTSAIAGPLSRHIIYEEVPPRSSLQILVGFDTARAQPKAVCLSPILTNGRVATQQQFASAAFVQSRLISTASRESSSGSDSASLYAALGVGAFQASGAFAASSSSNRHKYSAYQLHELSISYWEEKYLRQDLELNAIGLKALKAAQAKKDPQTFYNICGNSVLIGAKRGATLYLEIWDESSDITTASKAELAVRAKYAALLGPSIGGGVNTQNQAQQMISTQSVKVNLAYDSAIKADALPALPDVTKPEAIGKFVQDYPTTMVASTAPIRRYVLATYDHWISDIQVDEGDTSLPPELAERARRVLDLTALANGLNYLKQMHGVSLPPYQKRPFLDFSVADLQKLINQYQTERTKIHSELSTCIKPGSSCSVPNYPELPVLPDIAEFRWLDPNATRAQVLGREETRDKAVTLVGNWVHVNIGNPSTRCDISTGCSFAKMLIYKREGGREAQSVLLPTDVMAAPQGGGIDYLIEADAGERSAHRNADQEEALARRIWSSETEVKNRLVGDAARPFGALIYSLISLPGVSTTGGFEVAAPK